MSTANDLGRLVLRVTLAVLMLFHGISKLFNGVEPIAGMLARAGLPPALAYLVFIGEIIAPALMLLGIWTRIAAFIIAANMAVAVYLVHAHQFMSVSKTGGWALELQGFFFFTAVAVMLLGAGRFSVAGSGSRFN